MARIKSLKPRLKTIGPRLLKPYNAATRDRQRDDREPWRALYKTARWQRKRIAILNRDGWQCRQTGQHLLGTYPAPNSPVVDHKVPAHEFWWDGRRDLFWDDDNLQSVIKAWHDTVKQRLERMARP